MWNVTCPSDTKLIFQYHDRLGALEHVVHHLKGVSLPDPYRDIPGCSLEIADHKIWDDGLPCDVPNCRFNYIPEQSPNG